MSKTNVEDIYPLSPAQQSMLVYLVLSGSRSEVYFDQFVATLGPTDPAVLRRAWQGVVDRHPALRTLFVWENRDSPLQVVRREVELPWQEHDWSHFAEAERTGRFDAFLREDQALGFDLTKAPLTRVALIRWSEEEWKLVWSFSHFVLDGWSMAIVLREVQVLYAAALEGSEPELAPVPPYREFISWLRRQDPVLAEAHWKRSLGGFEPATPLPFDGTGGARESGWAALEAERPLSAETWREIQRFSREHQITPNTLFQGLWGLMLARFGGLDDVVFSSIVSGRSYELEGVESMVGMFVTALPVRVRVDPDAELLPWLQQLQAYQFEQRDFEYCSFEQIVTWAGMSRNIPLFESLLVYENYPVQPAAQNGRGLEIRETHLREANNIPLTFYMLPAGDRLNLKLCYHWQRFGDEAATRILNAMEALLHSVLERPASRLGDFALLRPAERRELIAAGTGPEAGTAPLPVHRLFEQQAARTPDAVAVESTAGGALTYRDLDQAANRLAHRLQSLGAGPESIVGLCAERSLEMVVGMLAVLKAGGAYLPIDPAYPADRQAFMLEDSGARVLLTQEKLLAELPASRAQVVLLDGDLTGYGAEPVGDEADLGNLAYIIYTSGSTGRPKGVLVSHASLAGYVRTAGEAFAIAPGDRVLQFASISFDTSAEEIYPCLTRGATLVLRDDAMVSSLDRFARDTAAHRISVLDLPTAYWHEWVAEMEAQSLDLPESLRLVILGGEQAQKDRLATWRRHAGDRVRLVNTYGPTEATIVTTRRELSGPEGGGFSGEIPIGRPVANAHAFVAGPGQDLLPAGLDGELLIGGPGLARGYLGRPDLTAERFVPDPFSGQAGARLYRSGDLVRLLPSGDLEFRGRTDHQVKVRGFRIELGEIEASLRALASVRDAVVTARDDGRGDKRLVAYVVPAGEPTPSVGELRKALQAKLPEHMVPSAFVVLEALPLTPSGKVDRRALPAPGQERPDLDSGFAAPRNPIEAVLVEIWSDLLGVERVGIYDDFFQLGGHSLLVAKLAARVRQAFQVELSMVEVFRTPTVADLASALSRAEGAQEMPELPPIRRAPRDQPIPLSFPQERVWFLNELTPGGNIAYNFQFTLWLRGPLQVGVLDRTFTEIVRRHESLRTSFPAVDGRPVQIIHEPWTVSLPVVDLRALPAELRHEESEKIVFESTQTPFDVAKIPILRWRLLRLEDDLWELVQVEQHFVHDGWSFGVFLREMKAIYTAFLAGEPSPLPELPIQYADFAAWQRELMEGESMERLMGYWKRRLEGSSTILELPTDRPRPNRPMFEGDITLFRLPVDLYADLRAFSRREGFTLYMTTLAGFFSLLHRYTGQEDILLGTNNANRRASEIESLIGMIVNTLVVRGDLTGDPDFRALLRRVREVSLETYAHQDMPFERLVQEIRPERQLGRNPLFQVMFNFHDAAVPDLEFADLEGAFRVRGNRSAKMDMNVILVPGAEQRVGLQANELDLRAVLHWEYNTELFDFPTVQRMIGHYMTLLRGVIENPKLKLSELPLLTAGERRQVIEEWNDTSMPERIGGLLHEPFARQAALDPSRIAVRSGDHSLTYGELDTRANQLAHTLRGLGVGPEVLVGLCVERSPDMLVGLLAILKAGGAYIPLDPSYPSDRLALVVEDAGMTVLLTQSSLRSRLSFLGETAARVLAIDDETAVPSVNGHDLAPLASPENLAYVIYTSGSTGRPKGVGIPHRAVTNFLTSMARRPGLERQDVLVAVTTLAFDIAVLELFLPLSVGARVELASRETAADGPQLAALIASSGATVMQATPATWRVLIEAGWEGDPGLKVLCGGEALPRDLADALLARVGSLWNVYGPTETTVWSALHPVGEGLGSGLVPIGRPIANTSIHMLDRNFEVAPQGIPGELYIGGEGLARGYLHRPDLTAERFLPDPFRASGARLYRTGDLARFLPGGVIEFLGRADHQVKVRGFRIELGEIESVLNAQPGVQQSVVVSRPDAAGDARLIAYVVPTEEARASAADLRAALERKLPEYMVPALFMELEKLPLTPNGKVDRKALPVPEGGALAAEKREHVEPRTPVESALAGIWAEVLGVERVGALDNFFSLGGHSLTATRVLSRVRSIFGVELPLSLVFEKRTVEGMASAIEAGMAAPAAPEPLEPALGEADLLAQAAAMSDAELDALLRDTLAKGGLS